MELRRIAKKIRGLVASIARDPRFVLLRIANMKKEWKNKIRGLEATDLPTEPQPLQSIQKFLTYFIYTNLNNWREKFLFLQK